MTDRTTHSDLPDRLRDLAFHWRNKGYPTDADTYELAALELERLRAAANNAYWLMRGTYDHPTDVPKASDVVIPALAEALGFDRPWPRAKS